MNDVLIVGAGPTGLMAALTLANRGITPRIIDRRIEPIQTSNALGIQPRTLEVWETLNIVEDAISKGHQLQGLTLSKPDHQIAQLSFTDLPTKFPFILSLPQAKTEALLASHLNKLGVTIERGVSLESLNIQGDHVQATCNGDTQSYRWVIGADGTKSTVRDLAGIPFEGKDLPQHFIMADLQVNWDLDPTCGHVILSPQGPIAYFPFDRNNNGRLIFDVTLDPELKKEKNPSFDHFKSLLKQRYHKRASLSEVNWISSFWVHSKLASSYRKGNLFLAGDAAHQHSPFGGQGLNTGAQDAFFLANLMADVLQNKESEAVLDSYEDIRRPIGEAVVKRTDLMTRIMTSSSKPLQMLRNAAIPIIFAIPPIRNKAKMTMTQLIYRS